MKIIGVIPARYKSSRFPGKPLVKLLGKPMIIWVCELVEKALGKENTWVATDDERIKHVVVEYGYQVIITSPNCLTGTDRLAEVASKIDADYYVNIQGDEPLLDPDDILNIIEVKKRNPNFVVNGMKALTAGEDPNNINIPKVLVNKDNSLIYMSRLPLPGIKEESKGNPVFYKQVCIYAFNKQELKSFASMNKKALFEHYEDIEILRFFDLGIPIKMVETKGNSLAVDIPEDVAIVEAAILKKQLNK